MNTPIYYIGGSKGGVGKSKVCWALIDYLTEQGQKILLLETDTSNPDVYKAHNPYKNENLVCDIVDLDASDGWIEMVNTADKYPEHCMVINSAARSNVGIASYGTMLRETLPELDRKLVTFWVINRQRDSIELLRGFINVFPDALVHVCRNMYFGDGEKFEIYNSSQAREIIEKTGKTLDFPALGDRVADKLYSTREPIWLALSKMPLGDRAELRRWRNAAGEMFKQVMEEA